MELNIIFVCLITGASLAVLFLMIKIVKIVIGIGKIGEMLLDIAFSLSYAVTSFLLSLAISDGKMRFVQAALMLAGAFAVIMVADPFVTTIAKQVNIIIGVVFNFVNKKLLKCLKLKRCVKNKKPKKPNKFGKSPLTRKKI